MRLELRAARRVVRCHVAGAPPRGRRLAQGDPDYPHLGTYQGDFPAEVVAERSTLEHATRMVNAAARLTLAVVDLVEDRLGESEPSREVRAELHRLAGGAAPTPNDEPPPGVVQNRPTLPELTTKDMTRPTL